ncbi:ABC transporter substrate-binding protein [Aureimonas sp. ME7]|uniref:siderophore ABC transporter substrate-binding protein n=1 Tax=Aureimonas sp. ME7 TaxID=2744252 RepID=UPI0015F54279|nr:ABC transporter substrate-binding protein [Aureimonas sp. ME7]
MRAPCRLLLCALLLGAFPFGAARAEPIAAPGGPNASPLPARPQIVATFDLAALDTLEALGVRAAGVPAPPVPEALGGYADGRAARIGSLFHPDYDVLRALRPDLVVISQRARPEAQALSRLAPVLDMTPPDGDGLEGAKRAIRTLAALFGHEKEAEARLGAIDRHLDGLRQVTAKAGRGLVVMTTGERISVFGPGSRYDIVHSGFGMAPVATPIPAETHGMVVDDRFIRDADPDWLFVIDRDAAVGEAPSADRLAATLVAETTAWRRGQVVRLDPVRWYLVGFGLAALEADIDEIGAAMDRAPVP